MKVKIKSFNGELPSYLTVGKIYEVVMGGFPYVDIVDDEGDCINVNIERSGHLNGGSWEVVE